MLVDIFRWMRRHPWWFITPFVGTFRWVRCVFFHAFEDREIHEERYYTRWRCPKCSRTGTIFEGGM